jgi:hypothetical protein
MTRLRTPWLTLVIRIYFTSLPTSLPLLAHSIIPPSIHPSPILNSNSKLTPSAIDQFASKEGLPAGLDPEVNNLVNDEVNKF